MTATLQIPKAIEVNMNAEGTYALVYRTLTGERIGACYRRGDGEGWGAIGFNTKAKPVPRCASLEKAILAVCEMAGVPLDDPGRVSDAKDEYEELKQKIAWPVMHHLFENEEYPAMPVAESAQPLKGTVVSCPKAKP